MKFSILQLKPTTRRGYTLLFSVIVSVLILSVAAFILSISRKQFILSSAARDSIYAFYAADSGMECAVENRTNSPDLLSTTSIYTSAKNNTPISITCDNVTWTSMPVTNPTYTQQSATTTWQMQVSGNSSACADVAVSYKTQNTDGSGGVNYAIESRGYNIGWNQTTTPLPTCSSYGPRRVERAIRYVLNF